MYRLENYCFLCLKPDVNTTSYDRDIEEKLKYLILKYHILQVSKIPKSFCNNCLETLNSSYKFQRKCVKNIEISNNYVQKLSHGNDTCTCISVKLTDILQNRESDTVSLIQANVENMKQELKEEILETNDYENVKIQQKNEEEIIGIENTTINLVMNRKIIDELIIKDENSDDIFECETCDLAFSTEIQLNDHTFWCKNRKKPVEVVDQIQHDCESNGSSEDSMVKNYIPKGNKKKAVYSKEDLKTAITEIKNGRTSVYRASKTYNIPYATIYTHVKGTRGIHKKSGRPTCIPAIEEEKLAAGLRTMEKWGFGLTRNELLETVGDYINSNNMKSTFKNGIPGEDWFLGFKKRHRLSVKVPQNVEYARKKALDPFNIYEYFEVLEKTIKNLDLQDKPHRIWNLDESSLSIDPRRTKVVGAINKASLRTISTTGKENTTILLMANAAGGKAPPLIIYKGLHIWDQWMADEDASYPGTVYAASKKGWMETEIFANYFVKTILPTIGEDRPVLIIFDGHSTHVSLPVIEKALQENITIIKLPPHTSHLLQPLDLAVFKSFKSQWDQKLISWQRQHVGLKLPKNFFSKFLCQTWINLPSQVIKNGFRKAGIYPLDKNIIPEDEFPPGALERWKKKAEVLAEPTLSTSDVDIPAHKLPPLHELVQLPDDGASGSSSLQTINPIDKDNSVPVYSSNLKPSFELSSNTLQANSGFISFEDLLLSKVQQKPTLDKLKRKSVCMGSEVITTKEAIERLRNKENDKKQKANKGTTRITTNNKSKKQREHRYSSDSDSSLETQIDPTYIDTDDDMDLEDIINSHEDSENDLITLKINSWVLVQYCTKNTVKHFVGQVIGKDEERWIVKFLKFSNEKFTWPKVEDTDTVHECDILKILPVPEVTRRGSFQFKVSFDGYYLK